MEKRVAIVGGGMSGLLACKYAASKGLNPIVFEAEDQVGGLWNHTIESTRLQNERDSFQFSDFPWPSSVQDKFPTNFQLLQYLKSYAQNFQLLPYIKFGTKVIDIDYEGESQEEMQSWEMWGGGGRAFASKGKWKLNVFHVREELVKEYVAEFVVLCVGRFSGVPEIPEFPPGYGPQVFSGKVLHSVDYAAMDNASAADFIKGKRIAIIGSGKSAVDIAFECANANGKDYPCIVIRRTAHWMVPDAQPWGVNVGFLLFNRFSELMVHKPGEDLLSSVVATLLTPLRWGVSKFIESYFRWKLPLKKYDMVPKQSLVQDVSSCQIMSIPDNFFDKVEDGSIIFRKSQQFSFCKQGLVLDGDDNNPLKVDIVIFATGYKGDEKLKNIFASPTFQNFIAGSSPTAVVSLYRQMIHPRIPQLAVIGYSESQSNLYTFEMSCKWLSFFLDEAFELPSIKAMEKDIEMWEKYIKRYAGNGEFRSFSVAGVHTCYNDQLCRDIGCNPRRKKGFFSELFEPYGLADYSSIH